MSTLSVICSNCGGAYDRPAKRVYEAQRFGWKSYCSSLCLSKGRLKRAVVTCGNPLCNKEFEKVISELCIHNYCSRSCSAKVNNLRICRDKFYKINGEVRKLNNFEIIKKLSHLRICPTCKIEFKGDRKYCSKECIIYPPPPHKGKSKYTKQILIEMIQDFVKKNGRIPVKREFTTGYSAVRDIFTNWNNAIIAAGFDPNPVLFANHHIAKDGHKCDSFAEMIIDNYLFSRNIKHEVHAPYPEEKKYSADFKVGDCWIEFFGLAGDHRRYDELRKIKLKLAKKLKLKLIEIYPRDLFPKRNLQKILNFL